MPSDTINLWKQHVHLQQSILFTITRNGHGYPDGTIVCYHRMLTCSWNSLSNSSYRPRTSYLSVVEVYRWCVCHLDTRGPMFEHVITGAEQLPHDNKIYSWLVSKGSHIPGCLGLHKKWRQIYMSNRLANISIYTPKVASLNIVRLLYHIVQPSGSKEFAWRGRTSH